MNLNYIVQSYSILIFYPLGDGSKKKKKVHGKSPGSSLISTDVPYVEGDVKEEICKKVFVTNCKHAEFSQKVD